MSESGEPRLTDAQAAELARSNAALEEFAYLCSHDLKEPLRGIHNYATFLKEDYAERLDVEGRDKLDTLIRLARRMNELIDALLEYSRVGRTQAAVGPTRIEAAVQDALETLAPALQEHAVEVRIRAPLPRLVCDSVRVVEVFRNLIGNAIKYRGDTAPWIEIGCREPDTRGEETHAADARAADGAGTAGAQDWPVLYVRDNGIGIAQEHFGTIFRMFKRLHARDARGGGVGAGLAIVERIVERHGGTIRVESTPGAGTTFYFTLGPAAGAPGGPPDPQSKPPALRASTPGGGAASSSAAAQAPAAASAARSDTRLRVLVVDDDEPMLHSLERSLCSRQDRWQLRFLGDPRSALDAVAEQAVDVIVSDLNMPGLAGDQLLEQVRQRSPHTLRILMTADTELASVLRSIGPSHRFIAKPCGAEEIEEVVRSALALREYLGDPLLAGSIGRIAKGPLFPGGSAELMEPTREVLRGGLHGARHLGARLLEQFRVGTAEGIDVNEFWRRASRAAHFADRICARESATAVLRSHAVLASLLHELGALILARYEPELLLRAERRARDRDLSAEDAQRATFRSTQDDVGAYTLGLWGFPDPIVEAVAFQRRPSLTPSSGFAPVSVVHVARALAHDAARDAASGEVRGLDLAYLDRLGLAHRLSPWLESCLD